MGARAGLFGRRYGLNMRRAFPAVLSMLVGKARWVFGGSGAGERKARGEACAEQGSGRGPGAFQAFSCSERRRP